MICLLFTGHIYLSSLRFCSNLDIPKLGGYIKNDSSLDKSRNDHSLICNSSLVKWKHMKTNIIEALYKFLGILTYFTLFDLHAQYEIIKATNITTPTLSKIISTRPRRFIFPVTCFLNFSAFSSPMVPVCNQINN